MLRLWPSEIICCHQQYLTHLKYGNSKVLLPTFHKLTSIAQIFLCFCLSNSSTSFFERENFECIILHYKSTFFHFRSAPPCRSGSSNSTADRSSIRPFTVNAGNKSKFPKYSFFTITNEGTVSSYSL